MNLTVITPTPEGFDVTVTLADGFTETIEGLYDLDSAIAFSHMHLTRTNRRYRP